MGWSWADQSRGTWLNNQNVPPEAFGEIRTTVMYQITCDKVSLQTIKITSSINNFSCFRTETVVLPLFCLFSVPLSSVFQIAFDLLQLVVFLNIFVFPERSFFHFFLLFFKCLHGNDRETETCLG